MAVLCLIYMVCALRVNLVFVLLQFLFVITFSLLPCSFWYEANGDTNKGRNLKVAGGAFGFAGSCVGWYMFIGILFEAVDFPIALPVGDLSTHFKGRKEKLRGRRAHQV